jgi:adenine C2-methylase RlmN of 23S rRNA A2503 and tRNA A37
VEEFAERLRQKDLPTYVRKSRGDEIAAGCGQLATSRLRTTVPKPSG